MEIVIQFLIPIAGVLIAALTVWLIERRAAERRQAETKRHVDSWAQNFTSQQDEWTRYLLDKISDSEVKLALRVLRIENKVLGVPSKEGGQDA